MNESGFYMVWNKNGRTPRYRHKSSRCAIDEAKRLAHLNEGQDFFVLKAIKKVTVISPIQIFDLDDNDPEIPF